MLVLATLVPTTAFELVDHYLGYLAATGNAERDAQAQTRAMALTVEGELQARIAFLGALALSRSLRDGDMNDFRRVAETAIAQQYPGANILVLREDGQQVVNTALPPEAPLPARQNLETVREVFRTGRPAVSNIFIGGALRRPLISIDVPVRGADGRVVYALSIKPSTDFLIAALGRHRPPESWVIAAFDRQGVTVARNLEPESLVGQKASSALLPRLLAEYEGVSRHTSRDGVRVLTAFARVDRFGWSVAIGVPQAELTAPALKAALSALYVAGALLAIGLALALVVARGIAGPIATVRNVAMGTDRDAILNAPSAGLPEADDVLRALQAAERRRQADEAVRDRAARLEAANRMLEADLAIRTRSQEKVQEQVGRLNLLHRITRAIGERQDLDSIFEVVVLSIEDQLPLDFCCLCLYDQVNRVLTVRRVGLESGALAIELAMSEHASFEIDDDGLSRCVRGEFVYEPDISRVEFPFGRRLAGGGLRSLVAAPLRVENEVIGVLLAARLLPKGFSSGECEFLLQLCEHAALAAHDAQLRGTLQAAYDDLRQTQQAMMQQDRLRMMGQMASGIAHDINNALSPVALYTESLLEREPGLSPRAREQLETIRRAVGDVAHTVARIRDFYRQREPQQAFAPVRLNQLVRQVVDLTRPRWSDMAQRAGAVIEVRTELAADLPEISGVESDIREALTNLILNSIDAMPGGGALTLRTRMADPARGPVLVEVADNGVGMDEETRRRCLEPFFTTKGERGTGLGLAMVYGVAQRHDADIDIESTPGESTTARLGFPLPVAATVATTRPEARPEALRPLRLLTIDDDPLLQRSLRDTLESDGHVVVAAGDGQTGIATFHAALERGERFDAVITDLGMPHIDGRKVAAAIKGAARDTPVILLTGWGQRLVAEGDAPPHVDHIVSKPPKMRDLRAALAELCRPSPG